jgi:hypothetical protein
MTSKKKLKRKNKKLKAILAAEREHSELTTQNWQQCDKLFASIVGLIVNELGEDWLQCTIDEIKAQESIIEWNIPSSYIWDRFRIDNDGKVTRLDE